MLYSEIVGVYEQLAATTKKLEKATILSKFLLRLNEIGKYEWIYLLKGRVVTDYDPREIGISSQLAIKAIGAAFGVSSEKIVERFSKIGDLGEIAEEFASRRKQSALFHKKLEVGKVFDNLIKIMDVNGKGAIERKIALITELLGNASGKEAKYIVRTLLSDLRIGVADGIIRDAIAEAFFGDEKKEVVDEIEKAYDLSGDFALVFASAAKGKKHLGDVALVPGKPTNVMLPVKVATIEEAFEACGKPVAIEHKYDGFRMVISFDGKEIKLFTRRLEDVTKQFSDVASVVKKHVKGESFILDSEVVGYDPKTKKYKPFEAISQRIKRKYDIDKLIHELPVEVNVFDILYYNGKSVMDEPFRQRRYLIEKIVKNEEWKIRVARQIVTDKEEEAIDFYKAALKMGEEGVIVKNINASYRAGRRVGFMVKLKPDVKDLDLVIVGAEYGTGKRAGWLTSYILGCASNEKFLEIGKVSSGLKEKENDSEGAVTYDEMTKLLRPLIIEEKGSTVSVKPKLIVSVTYQNIQVSPSYSSGFALRFPRITRYRPDKGVKDIATLDEIKKEWKRMQKGRGGLG